MSWRFNNNEDSASMDPKYLKAKQVIVIMEANNVMVKASSIQDTRVVCISVISRYTELCIANKFILTMPTTQVTCERVFPKLTHIKSRLKSVIHCRSIIIFTVSDIERNLFIKLF